MSELTELVKSLSDEQIIEIMTTLGADRYEQTHNAIIFPTICHNVDAAEASMKLYYYPKTKTFHCYTDCGSTFNIIEMFKKRFDLLGIKYDFYKDIVLKIGGGQRKSWGLSDFTQRYESIYNLSHQDNSIELPEINKGVLNVYTFNPTPEWLNDGISVEIMRKYNILYSISENKIIIPHYDINNRLIGIRGRALNEEDLIFGKYMPVMIEGKTYNHPLQYNLYGLNLVKDNIKKFKMAIVAEGEKSPMQYGTMFGQENNITVATCGSTFHKYQLDLLISCGAERILIAYDKEGETWAEQEAYVKKLESLCQKYRNYCIMGYIYDYNHLLKLKQSPFDCGPEVARKLISKGVWF